MKRIFLILQRKPKTIREVNYQNILASYLADNFSGYEINVKFSHSLHINETKLDIGDKDFVLFTPIMSASNLDLVQKLENAVIVFESKTVYLQRISPKNPINENVVIHRDIKILYLTDFEDKTNEDWKLVIEPHVIDVEYIKQNL